MSTTNAGWVSRIASMQNMKGYSDQHWEGSFEDYLDLVRKDPKVTRTVFQRVYDMVLSHGKTEYIDNKKKLVRYDFFTDPDFGGKDAIYGLDIALMKLVNVFKSAAQGYGTEKRVILLHGPVGSSKSTIARLLKKGLEAYSKTPEGALYTFSWDAERTGLDGQRRREVMPCPMHEEPVHLVPQEWRARVYGELAPPGSGFTIADTGDLCPACRFVYRELMTELEEADGRPRGLAWFRRSGTLGMGGYLRLIAVAAEATRGGTGSRVLHAFEAEVARESRHAFLLVSDFNQGAQRFYQRHGYARAGSLPGLVLPDVAEILYWKRLR